MTEEFMEWVRTCANTLGLSDWEIEVRRESLPDDTLGRCFVPRARQSARILIGDTFAEASREEQRATIVHELLHCHFAPLVEIVEESLPMLLGKPAYHSFETAHDLALERCLEAQAVAFANLLPLPPEGE
jgi:hypothetical protein